MKIAHVSLYPGRSEKHIKASGVASYTKNLLDNIPHASNDDVYVVCNKLDGKKELYQEDGMVIMRSFDRNYKIGYQLYKALRRIKPDVVHIQQELPLYGRLHTNFLLQGLLLILKLHSVPVVITLHHVVDIAQINKQFVQSNNSKAPAWLVKLAFQIIYKPIVDMAAKVIVHERLFKDRLLRQYGAAAEKVSVIPHGVENFQALDCRKARDKLNIPDDSEVVLFMGYLAGYKGFDLLLEGFAEYAKQNPKAYLVIGAGKHPKLEHTPAYIKEYQSKQAKAAELIPASQYRWVGFIDEKEVKYYYSASDVSLYPYSISLSSSGPMSFAMGYEKPFLASDVFADVMPQEVIFARQPSAMADRLRSFFANPQVLSNIARSMKAERLWTRVGERTMSLYRETVA